MTPDTTLNSKKHHSSHSQHQLIIQKQYQHLNLTTITRGEAAEISFNDNSSYAHILNQSLIRNIESTVEQRPIELIQP